MADRRRSSLATVLSAAVVSAVLLVVAVAARSGTPLSATLRPVQPLRLRLRAAGGRVPADVPGLELPAAGGLLWFVAGGSLLLVVLLVFGLLMALRAFLGRPLGISRRERPAAEAVPDAPTAADDELRSRLHGEVMAGLEDLDEASDPRRAVIACWLRLERAVAEAGAPRRVAETPGELVARVLAEHRVRPGALARLTTLYREARYSTHAVDDDVRRSARAALDDVRRDLTGVPA